MRVVVVKRAGGPEALEMGSLPDPIPGPEHLLVRNFAAGVNRADLLQRRGLYPPPAGESEVIGLEFAGEVLASGESVRGFDVGDRVFGLVAGGAYAEVVRVHHRLVLPIPDHFSYEAAAAVPEAFLTAQEALLGRGDLESGERVLIHAGASGVGTAAIQLARVLGAKSFITAGSSEKVRRCLELGADHGICRREEDFADRILELTAGEGVDLILDLVGADYWDANVRALKTAGRIVILGLLGGSRATVDLSQLLLRRLQIRGMAMRGLPLSEKIAIVDRFRESFLPLLDRGDLQPVVDEVFLFGEVRAAHERMEANLNVGKIVLRL